MTSTLIKWALVAYFLLIVLKGLGIIGISWAIVLSPIWITALLAVFVALFYYLVIIGFITLKK